MKRNAFDVLRRGFDNVVANWPLIVIRVVEGMVMVGIVIGAVIAAVIPILVSAGLDRFHFNDVTDASQFVAMLIFEHWALLLYLFGLAFVLLGVLIAVHSFVEAGSAQVYIDGERIAGFRAFAMDRWMSGGRLGWWPVFWIYNFAWSIGGLVILIPAVLTIVFMLLVNDVGPRVAVGCAGLAFIVLLMIPVGILVGIWTQKAITICVARAAGAAESLAMARREIKLDFGRHLGVALMMMVISFVVAGAVSGVSIPFQFGNQHHVSFVPLFFAPMQLMLSVIQTALSAAVGSWFLASFVALTEEH